MRVVAPDPEGIAAAVQALRNGDVVAYPTETVYGLAVDPMSEAALAKLYAVKGRDESFPVLLLIGERAQLDALVDTVSPTAEQCIEAFWPGPLSLLFPKAEAVPERLANAEGDICVRLSSNPVARSLPREFGGAITSTSANLSGEPPALRTGDVPAEGIAVCINGGVLEGGTPSTVYDCARQKILRTGPISARDISGALEARRP